MAYDPEEMHNKGQEDASNGVWDPPYGASQFNPFNSAEEDDEIFGALQSYKDGHDHATDQR